LTICVVAHVLHAALGLGIETLLCGLGILGIIYVSKPTV